jgi:hypothetical protein
VASGPTSPKIKFEALPVSTETATMTGRTGSGSENCTIIGTRPIIGACDRRGGLRRPPSHRGRRWLRNHRSHRRRAPLVGEVSRRSRRRRSVLTSVRRPNGGSLTKRGGLSEHSSSGTSPRRSSSSAKLPISPRLKVTIPTSDSAGLRDRLSANEENQGPARERLHCGSKARPHGYG